MNKTNKAVYESYKWLYNQGKITKEQLDNAIAEILEDLIG